MARRGGLERVDRVVDAVEAVVIAGDAQLRHPVRRQIGVDGTVDVVGRVEPPHILQSVAGQHLGQGEIGFEIERQAREDQRQIGRRGLPQGSGQGEQRFGQAGARRIDWARRSVEFDHQPLAPFGSVTAHDVVRRVRRAGAAEECGCGLDRAQRVSALGAKRGAVMLLRLGTPIGEIADQSRVVFVERRLMSVGVERFERGERTIDMAFAHFDPRREQRHQN